MKRILVAATVLSALVPCEASAEPEAPTEAAWGPFTATVALTSDYRFRGQSQTDRSAAVQGGITYSGASGLFANAWASSIDFNDPQESPAEVDLSGGYSHAFSDTVQGSLTAAYYWYPSSAPAHYDYFEILADLSDDFGVLALSAEFTYSPDYSGKTGNAFGLSSGVDIPVTFADVDWLSASAHAGYQWIDNNALYGTPDWLFYDLGLTATWQVFEFDLRYTGTDTRTSECFGGTKLCQSGLVLTLTANLPGA